ncbi:MAG TPA: carotenoid biosynthesis protein [Longimicrobium sp.]|nr:carotenoid biosynthesis protein [Longimicrobium sp.]
MRDEREPRERDRVADAALAVLYLFTLAALAGYASFGLHPGLLVRYPDAAGVYAVAFTFFARAQIVLAGAVLALLLVRRAGLRWLPAFAALYALSLGSELLGTSAGIPFGDYRYTEALGTRWFGLVPALIPLSWFFMAVPSYALARHALPGAGRGAARVLLASLVLVGWDLSLDPAMSHATRYWVWGQPGPYYGMPLLNLAGWYVTGLALMAALALLRADAWIARLPVRWMALFYGANLLLPVGMIAARGMWGALAATLGALAVAGMAMRLRAMKSAARAEALA